MHEIIIPQPEEKKRTAIYMDYSLYAEILRIAKNNEVPINQVLIELLHRGLNNNNATTDKNNK